MKRVFSQRFEASLADGSLTAEIPKKLRRRIWYSIDRFNLTWREVDESGYNCDASHIEKVREHLRERYGLATLSVWSHEQKQSLGNVSLETFVLLAPWSRVFDAVELLSAALESTDAFPFQFQRHLNEVLDQEHFEWRFADGQFFQLDTEYLAMEVLVGTDELLRTNGYAGAEEEFTKSRACVASEDYKEAILNAAKSFESVMKTLLKKEHGNAAELVRELMKSDLFKDLPRSLTSGFGEQILMTLPHLRNRLSGHGQGIEVVSVGRAYAALAVHLAGALNYFLVSKGLELEPAAPGALPEAPDPTTGQDFAF